MIANNICVCVYKSGVSMDNCIDPDAQTTEGLFGMRPEYFLLYILPTSYI